MNWKESAYWRWKIARKWQKPCVVENTQNVISINYITNRYQIYIQITASLSWSKNISINMKFKAKFVYTRSSCTTDNTYIRLSVYITTDYHITFPSILYLMTSLRKIWKMTTSLLIWIQFNLLVLTQSSRLGYVKCNNFETVIN